MALDENSPVFQPETIPGFSAEDVRFMGEALEQARAAEKAGEVPVGAILVIDGAVAGRGHNRLIGLADPTAHAEILALRAAASTTGAARLPGSELFVTLEPCLMCLGAMIHARVGRLVFAAPDPKVGATRWMESVPVGFYGLNHRLAIQGGLLAGESAALLQSFFRQRR